MFYFIRVSCISVLTFERFGYGAGVPTLAFVYKPQVGTAASGKRNNGLLAGVSSGNGAHEVNLIQFSSGVVVLRKVLNRSSLVSYIQL